MKPSEQLKGNYLPELKAKLNQTFDELARMKDSYNKLKKESNELQKELKEMVLAIEGLESKGL